jgi:hypothetical protein
MSSRFGRCGKSISPVPQWLGQSPFGAPSVCVYLAHAARLKSNVRTQGPPVLPVSLPRRREFFRVVAQQLGSIEHNSIHRPLRRKTARPVTE